MGRKVALATGITGQEGAYHGIFFFASGYTVHGIKRNASLLNTQRGTTGSNLPTPFLFLLFIAVSMAALAIISRLTIKRAQALIASSETDVSLYVVNPISKHGILPNTPANLFSFAGKPDANTIHVNACRDEYQPASFVIKPAISINNIIVSVSDLKGPRDAIVSHSEIDVRLVKCWYQAGHLSVAKEGKVMVPEATP